MESLCFPYWYSISALVPLRSLRLLRAEHCAPLTKELVPEPNRPLSREQPRWEMKSQEQQRKSLPKATEEAINMGWEWGEGLELCLLRHRVVFKPSETTVLGCQVLVGATRFLCPRVALTAKGWQRGRDSANHFTVVCVRLYINIFSTHPPPHPATKTFSEHSHQLPK